MSDGKVTSPHTPLPRVRTYARDLEEQRSRRAQPVSIGTNAPAVPSAPPVSVSQPVSTPTVVSASLPPTNDHTSTPLPTASRATNTNLGAMTTTGPSLSESVAAAVSATAKRHHSPAPAVLGTEPKTNPSLPTPISIPPFHELTRTNQPNPKRTTSATSAPDYGATIITDTQSRRFKLFPNLFSSLAHWWEARAKRRAAARTPKYVIPETDRRKGVIQRATSQTAKVTTGDYEGLRERLRERVEATVAAPSVPAPEDHEETFWTPHIEPIFPLLEAPQYTSSSVQRVSLTPRRKIGDTVTAETARDDDRWEEAAHAYSTPALVTPPTPAPAPIITPPEPVVPAPTRPQPASPVPTPTPAPASDLDMDEDAPLPAPTRPVPSTNPKRRPAPVPARQQFLFRTNTMTVTIVGVVVLGSLAVYLAPRLLELTRSAPVDEQPVVTQSTVVAAPVITRVVSLPTRDAIMTALNISEDERTLPAVEVVLSGNTAPATLLQTLDPSLPPSLVQNISKLSFGWYDRSEPFIIMTITDRTSVWGSLLQGEERLPKVLTPLFTSPDTGGRFVDRVIGGHDVRTLIDDTKHEHLSYGLIDEHTLIITTDTSTFLSVETLVTTVR